MNGLEKELKMKLFNQKGLSLVEVMVVIFILGIVTVGIMKQMDFQMKTQSHMNQKMTTDLFTQGLKELLSSEDACSNSMGGIKISEDEDMSFKELKDHRGNTLYKTADSEETSGKNKIDDSVKIKSMKVLSFTKDEDENSDEGFLTLEIELEKLNKSMANQVFKRRIDAIRASQKPLKFTIKATKVYSTGSYFGYMGESFGNYSQNGSSQSGAPSGFIGISNGSGNIYIYADEPLYSQIKNVKIKKLGDDTSERTYTFTSGGDYSDKKKTYKGGVSNQGLSFNDPNATYEIEFLNDDEESDYRISSCKYVGMRKTASLGGGLANSGSAIPGCEATNSPEVKCGGNKAITENVPALDHQDTHKLNARKVTNGNAECVCAGNFICDGLTLNSNNKGTISDKGVICIPKTILADLTGTGRDGRDGAIAGVCGVQDLTHTNGCLYKLKTTLVHGTGSKAIFTTEADVKKGAATVKCNAEGRVEFESATCNSTYTCLISHLSQAELNLLHQNRPGATIGLPGEKIYAHFTTLGQYCSSQCGPSRSSTLTRANFSCASPGSWSGQRLHSVQTSCDYDCPSSK